MKKIILSLLFYFSFVCLAHAYHLSGSMINNNNGTYAITLHSDNGEEYLGTAIKQGDGTLVINAVIEGGGSETYIGLGTPNHDGTYALSLRNNTSGEMATGQLTE